MPEQGYVWALKNTQDMRKTWGTKEKNNYMPVREMRTQQPTHTVILSLIPMELHPESQPKSFALTKHEGVAVYPLLRRPH